jgi:hypothetical protein
MAQVVEHLPNKQGSEFKHQYCKKKSVWAQPHLIQEAVRNIVTCSQGDFKVQPEARLSRLIQLYHRSEKDT